MKAPRDALLRSGKASLGAFSITDALLYRIYAIFHVEYLGQLTKKTTFYCFIINTKTFLCERIQDNDIE